MKLTKILCLSFAITAFGSYFCFSQNQPDKTSQPSLTCNDVSEIKTDKMEGITTLQAKNFIALSDKNSNSTCKVLLFKMIPAANDYITISILVSGKSGCVEKDGRTNILFTDDTRLIFTNQGGFNCSGKTTLLLSRKVLPKHFDQLSSKKVKAIRVWVGDWYFESELTPEQADELSLLVNCLEKG